MAPTCCNFPDQQNTPNTCFIFCWAVVSRFQTGRNQGNFDLNLSIAFYPCVDLSFAHRLKEENSTDRAFRLAGHHSVLPHHRSGTRHFPGTGSMQLSPTWRSLQVVTNILQDMVYVYIYIYRYIPVRISSRKWVHPSAHFGPIFYVFFF